MVVRKIKQKITEETLPIWVVPSFLFGLVALACIGFFLYYFGPKWNVYAGRVAGPTTNTREIGVEVSGTLFVLPANYTRYAHQRRQREHAHITLHALLPDLVPYTAAHAKAFLRTDAHSPLLLINLVGTGEPFDSARYIDSVVLPQTLPDRLPAPEGLRGLRFKPDTPYAQQQLFITRITGASLARRAFVCDPPSAPTPNCESRFGIGTSVIASYVFKRAHLGDWRAIDATVQAMIKSFRANSRKFRL